MNENQLHANDLKSASEKYDRLPVISVHEEMKKNKSWTLSVCKIVPQKLQSKIKKHNKAIKLDLFPDIAFTPCTLVAKQRLETPLETNEGLFECDICNQSFPKKTHIPRYRTLGLLYMKEKSRFWIGETIW